MTTTPAARSRRTTRGRAVARTTAALGAVTLALTACAGGDDPADGASGTVVLVTHSSFAISDELVAQFEAETGLTLEQSAPGDGGSLVNQLVLTVDDPLGDVVFGIDNTFATRALDAGVLAPYRSPAAGPDTDRFAVDDDDLLTAVDFGDVCMNADLQWFAENDLAVPQTLEDLADPAYEDLLVVTNPATSSPGLAFLLATVGAFGENGWQDYWASLRDNGVRVAGGWSDAYYVDFSGSDGQGPRPLVLSYASSPSAEVPEGADESRTAALLDTCFRQVEYAGVLANADNPEGAELLLDFLLGEAFQAEIPDQMYVYPVSTAVGLPQAWESYAPLAEEPFEVDPREVDAHRDAWISTWTDVVIG